MNLRGFLGLLGGVGMSAALGGPKVASTPAPAVQVETPAASTVDIPSDAEYWYARIKESGDERTAWKRLELIEDIADLAANEVRAEAPTFKGYKLTHTRRLRRDGLAGPIFIHTLEKR